MKTWMRGVALVSVLAACGDNAKECATAKKTVLEGIDASRRHQLSLASLAKEEAKSLDPAKIDTVRAKFDEEVKRAELELDCKRLGKASVTGLIRVQEALNDMMATGRSVVMEAPDVAKLVDTAAQFYETNVGTFSGPNPDVPKLCASLRERVAKLKQDLPPLWEKARGELAARFAENQKKLDATNVQLAALEDKQRAVTGGKRLSSVSKDEMTTEQKAYETACH